MSKLVCTKTGEEVKMGEKIKINGKVKTPFGTFSTSELVTLNEESVSHLINMGLIEEAKEKDSSIPMDIEYYINKIADRMKWHPEKVCNYLNNLDSVYPAAAFSLVLREIAVELDKQYKDHIENSEEIFVISLFDGRITKANKAHIKNYRNFAAFRSVKDARVACKILKSFLKDLFTLDCEKGK